MNDLLQRGIAALRAGNKADARRLLGRAIQINPQSEQAWLWLSGAVDTDEERLMCLNKVLAINPSNEIARRGVAQLRQKQASQSVVRPEPTPPAPTLTIAPTESFQLDHSQTLDQLSLEKRKALEGFEQLIAQELAIGRKQAEIIERITKRGFPRAAVEQLVSRIAQGPRRDYAHKRAIQLHTQLPSPWLMILTSPRATMRRIVDTNPKHHVLLLAALAGFIDPAGNLLVAFAMSGRLALRALPIALGITAIAGPIGGLISLYVGGFVLAWVGGWLGGGGSPVEVRAAIAWSSVPRIWAAILWVIEFFLFAALLSTATGIDADTLLIVTLVDLVLKLIIGTWSLIVYLQCLSEVHLFSAWRALATSILASLAMGLLFGCVMCSLSSFLSETMEKVYTY